MRWPIAIALAAIPCVLMIATSSPASAKGGVGCAITLSGGDLPHPVTIPEDDCANAIGRSYHASYPVDQPPDVTGVTGYEVGSAEGEDANVYYPRPDTVCVELCQACDPGHRWTAYDPTFDKLYRRFIALARAGLIGEHPSWADALSASARLWPVEVAIDKPALNLTGPDAERFTAELRSAQPVSVGIRSRFAGAPSASALMFSQIFVRFGDADELAFSAWLPGELSDSALLFTSRTPFSAAAYYPINPPAMVQSAYAATPALNDLLRVQAVPDLRAQKEVKIVPVPAIFHGAERQINRITAGTARGQTIDVQPTIQREDAFSYLDQPPASPRNLGPPIPLTFHLATLYDPFPEAFLDIRADYYPQGGMALIKGETIGSGHLDPGWASVNAEFVQILAPLVDRSNPSDDASHGFGARLPFILTAVGVAIALASTWLATYLNSRKTSQAQSPSSRN